MAGTSRTASPGTPFSFSCSARMARRYSACAASASGGLSCFAAGFSGSAGGGAISRTAATRSTRGACGRSAPSCNTRSPSKAVAISRSAVWRMAISSLKRTSSLLGCTFTLTADGGSTTFSAHMGYSPMVTRVRQTSSSARVSAAQRTARPLMKNAWCARVAFASSPTPISPQTRMPPSAASTSTICSAVCLPYTANTACLSLPSPKLWYTVWPLLM